MKMKVSEVKKIVKEELVREFYHREDDVDYFQRDKAMNPDNLGPAEFGKKQRAKEDADNKDYQRRQTLQKAGVDHTTLKEYRVAAGPSERIGYLAQLCKGVSKEPDSGDGYVSYRFDLIDGGEVYWDLMDNAERLELSGFHVMTASESTEEATNLIKTLQTEFHDAEMIAAETKKYIGKVKQPVEEPESYDFA